MRRAAQGRVGWPADVNDVFAKRVRASTRYRVTLDGQGVNVIHYDLYRMASPEEFLDAGFREDFDGRNICIVEWPEKAQEVLPQPDLRIILTVAGDGRDVELQAFSALGKSCLQRLHFPQIL